MVLQIAGLTSRDEQEVCLRTHVHLLQNSQLAWEGICTDHIESDMNDFESASKTKQQHKGQGITNQHMGGFSESYPLLVASRGNQQRLIMFLGAYCKTIPPQLLSMDSKVAGQPQRQRCGATRTSVVTSARAQTWRTFCS